MSLNIRLYQSCSLDIVRSLAFWGTCFLALECGPVTSSRQGGRKGRTWSSRLGVHWLSLLVSELLSVLNISSLCFTCQRVSTFFLSFVNVLRVLLWWPSSLPTLLCFSVLLWSQKGMGTNACAQLAILNWQWKCLLIYSGIIPSCFPYLSIPQWNFLTFFN